MIHISKLMQFKLFWFPRKQNAATILCWFFSVVLLPYHFSFIHPQIQTNFSWSGNQTSTPLSTSSRVSRLWSRARSVTPRLPSCFTKTTGMLGTRWERSTTPRLASRSSLVNGTASWPALPTLVLITPNRYSSHFLKVRLQRQSGIFGGL